MLEGHGAGGHWQWGGPQVPHVHLSDTQVYPLGLALDIGVERGLPGEGMEAGSSLGHKILASQSFIGLPTSLWTQRGEVTCSRMHSMSTGFLTLDSSTS